MRIVTVGLNPSEREFSGSAPFSRFPGAEATADNPERYLSSLDGYFRTKPYEAWFSNFEQILQGLGVSFYAGRSVALHTDLCSP